MGVRSKTLATVLLVGAVVGILTYTSSNENLFKGQIFGDPESSEGTVAEEGTTLPDLTATLEVLPPVEGNENIIASVSIKNIGQGTVSGDASFKYSIFVDGQEVFTNTDSYSAIAPGDSFDFEYPIPKTIYGYGDAGNVKFVIDVDNKVAESDERNNEITKAFSF